MSPSGNEKVGTLFYEQLESGPTPQNCLYFQDFQGKNLINGCLVVWQKMNSKIIII